MHVAPVLHNTAIWHVHGAADDPGSQSKLNPEDDRDDPDLGELPLDRASLGVSVVVGDSDGSQVSEQCDEYDQIGADSLVDDDHGCDEVDLEVQTERDTVLNVRFHALKDLACNLDGKHDSG